MLGRWYDRIVFHLVFAAFSIMLLAALAGTVSRYLTFLPSISWGEEVTRFAGIWSVFLVAGLSIRHGAHLGVDVVTRLLPPAAQRLAAYVVLALILGFSLLLLVYGIQISAENMGQYSAALQLRMGLVYLCIPVGASLMILETLAVARRSLRGEPGHRPPMGGAVE